VPAMPNLMTEQICFNGLCLVGVVSGNWEGEKCKALAKHEYKLVLGSKIIVAVLSSFSTCR
jgi:hypothetical protein